jgi:hypothetical protein
VHEQRGNESAIYGYGLLVCDRIVSHLGFDGLHELCLRATAAGHEVVPSAWLLAAAGLDREPASWRAALVESLQAPELAAQCEFLANELTSFVVRTFRFRYPGLSGEAFLDRSLPTVGWAGGDARVALAMVDDLRQGILDGWERSGPRALSPGDGWWLRDSTGVHLTSLLPPAPDDSEAFYTVSRLALGEPREGGSGASIVDGTMSSIPTDQARVEAYLQIGQDSRGVWLKSLHPLGLESFTVELDGFVAADLERGLNVDQAQDDHGWVSVSCRLPGDLLLEGMVLFDGSPNLRVSQQGVGDEAGEVQFPLRLRRAP